MSECIFCKIGAGDIEANVVYEDDTVIAFEDLSPQAPVHTLVIPRAHFSNLSDDVPGEVLAALLRAVKKVARAKGVEDSGYRTIVNSGRDANQTVGHLHVHVLGGKAMSHGMVGFD